MKTSVEWLVDEIEKHYITNIGTLDPTIVMELRRQAKEMEKERIMTAFMKNLSIEYGVINAVQKAEQYYNETFGGEK
jgi:hypothetical protein